MAKKRKRIKNEDGSTRGYWGDPSKRRQLRPSDLPECRQLLMQYDTKDGGLTQFRNFLVRHWLRLHDKHMGVMSEALDKIEREQYQEARELLEAHITKWEAEL